MNRLRVASSLIVVAVVGVLACPVLAAPPEKRTAADVEGLFERMKLDEAKTLVDELIAAQGTTAELLALRARVRAAGNDAAGALADADEAVRLAPKSAVAHAARAAALRAAKRNDDALAAAETAVKLDPKSPRARLNRGLAKWSLKKLDEAHRDFAEALKIDPKFAPATFATFALFHEQAKWDEALKACDDRLAARPDLTYWLQLKRGEALEKLGRTDDALAAYRTARTAEPSEVLAPWKIGVLLKARGDLAGAIEAYDAALKIAPGDPAVLVARAQAQLNRSAFAEALADLDVVLKADPKNTEALRYRGSVYFYLRRFDESVADLDALVKLSPKDTGALVDRGRTHWNRGDKAQADTDFAAAKKLAPNFPSAYQIRLSLLIADKSWDEALAECTSFIAAVPTQAADVLLTRGWVRLQLGQSEEALKDFRESAEKAPQSAEPPRRIAELLKARGDWAGAVKAYDDAVRLAPQDLSHRLWRGEALLNTNRHAESLADYDAVLKAEPNNQWALRFRTRTLIGLKRLDDALANVNALLAILPGDASAYTDRGYIHFLKNDLEKAEADYTASIAADPKYQAPLVERTRVRLQLRKFDEAWADTEAAVKLPPPSAPLHVLRSRLLHAVRARDGFQGVDFNKLFVEVNRELTRAIEIDPTSVDAYAERANLYALYRRFDDAGRDLEAGLKLAPDNPQLYFQRGALAFQQGDTKAALPDFDAAIRLAPDYVQPYAMRAKVRRKLGDSAGAEDDLAVVAKLNPKMLIGSSEAPVGLIGTSEDDDTLLRRLSREGEFAAAAEFLERKLATTRADKNAPPTALCGILEELADKRALLGQHDEALRLTDEQLALEIKSFGEKHSRVAEARVQKQFILAAAKLSAADLGRLRKNWSESATAQVLIKDKRYVEALPIAEKVLAEYVSLLGQESESAWIARWRIAECLGGVGRTEEAERTYRDIAAGLTRLYGVTTNVALVAEHDAAMSKMLHVGAGGKDGPEVLAAALEMSACKSRSIAFSAANPATTDETRSQQRRAFLSDGDFVAYLAEVNDDLDALEKLRKEMLTVAQKEFGPDDGRTKDAEFALQSAAKLRTWSPQRRAEQNRLADEAAQLGVAERFVEAVVAQRKVVANWKELLGERHPTYAQQLQRLAAYIQLADGDDKEVESSFARALELQRELLGSQHGDVAATLRQFARYYREVYRNNEALALQAEACRIESVVSGHTSYERAEALQELVETAAEIGNRELVEREGLELLRVRSETSGSASVGFAAAAMLLANHFRSVGKFDEAIVHTDAAANGLRRMAQVDFPRLAVALKRRAAILWDKGDVAAADLQFRECLELCEKQLGADHRETLNTLYDFASFKEQCDDLTEAESLCRRGLERARAAQRPDKLSVAEFLARLGHIHMSIGDQAAARRMLQEALDLKLAYFGPDDPRIADALTTLATNYAGTADDAQVGPLLQRAYEIRKKAQGENHPETLRAYMYWGLHFLNLGLLPPAEEVPRFELLLAIYAERHGLAHPETQKVRDLLAMIHWKAGNYEKSENLLRVVLETMRQTRGDKHTATASAHHGFARLLTSQGRYPEAAEHCRAAVAVYRTYLEAAAAGLSEREQLAMTKQLRQVVDVYMSAAMSEAEEGAAAYDVMLDWKGMVWIRQQLQRAAADQPELLPLFDKLQRLTGELARRSLSGGQLDEAQRAQLAELTAAKETLERDLSARSAAYRKSRQATTAADLRKVLDDDTALVDLLEYHRYFPATKEEPGMGSDRRSYLAVVVRRDGAPTYVDLGPAKPIADAVDRWRASLGRGADGEAAGRLLRTAVWEPVEKHLDDAATILISPDGDLGKFPFAALPGRKPETFLIEERAIVVIPVPQALPLLLGEPTAATKPDMKDLLLVGDVDYGSSTAAKTADKEVAAASPRKGISRLKRAADWKAFEPLEGAAAEIAVIGKLFQDDKESAFEVTMLDKERAREERFMEEAPRHRYLHAATHGFFAPESLTKPVEAGPPEGAAPRSAPVELPPGLLCGLALAGANRLDVADEADGILTADEVQVLDLRGVEMAVLSACETGLGSVAGGEGVLGLQRAFQIAGARTTITSLWKVDDAQTQVLMARMYRNLLQEGLGTVEALREAQLWMLRKGPRRDIRLPTSGADGSEPKRSPPYYWAPFVLSGDWR